MDAVPSQRGNALLLAHIASLDPATPPARERLEEAVGRELALRLVGALSNGAPRRDGPGLRTRFVFAA